MSHYALPGPVSSRLTRFVSGIEDALQAGVHAVGAAQDQHPGFGVNWLQTDLVRAIVSATARDLEGDGLRVDDKGNGGVEATIVHERIERRFRVKRVKGRDGRGELIVTANSDSFLTLTARAPNLFDEEPVMGPTTIEQWVLAHMLDPRTLTFAEVSAGRVVDVVGKRSPFRLKLADLAVIPHTAPLPPDFRPGKDDLDLGEDEDRGEEAG